MQHRKGAASRLFDSGQNDLLPPLHLGFESVLWNPYNRACGFEEIDVVDSRFGAFLKNPLQFVRSTQRLNQPKA